MIRLLSRPVPLALALVGSLALGACEGNVVKDIVQSAGIGGEPKPAPDFVSRTRASRYDYMPIGVAPARRAKPKDADEVADSEAGMDAVRSRNEGRGAAARAAAAASTPPAPVPTPKAP